MDRLDRHGVGTLIVVGAVLILVALAVVEVRFNRALAEEPANPWSVYINTIDDALTRRDISTASRVWNDAHSAALRSRRWEAMLDVGDSYLRIGDVGGSRKASEPRARQVYLGALLRARADRSLDGVLRAARAFAGLVDYEVAEQCVRIAGAIAAQDRDPHGGARVRAFALELADTMFLASQVGP